MQLHSNTRFIITAHIYLDDLDTNLVVRINDGASPWVITHSFQRYRREGQEETAAYLAKRYLISRPDQLRHHSVAELTGLLLGAFTTYETREACA